MFHEQVSNVTSGSAHATTVQPVLQVPNCAVHGICSTGRASDVVRIHTTMCIYISYSFLCASPLLTCFVFSCFQKKVAARDGGGGGGGGGAGAAGANTDDLQARLDDLRRGDDD